MEMLNYSLWFTLAWWVFVIIVLYKVQEDNPNSTIENNVIFTGYILIPAIAILLEYLIVR